jgi:hypothetical protein
MAQSRDWSAIEAMDPASGRRALTVTGEVETTAGNQTPRLAPTSPQGINPKDLILVLSIETSGDAGADVMGWRRVAYLQPVTHRQYTLVTITGESQASIKVEEVS